MESRGLGTRNVSIDAFRCLLMFLIVLHHASIRGYWKDETNNFILPLLYTTLIFWHVDGFIAISGWFGCHFTLVRFSRLFGVMLFYSIFHSCYLYFIMNVPIYNAIGVHGGWYGNTYLAFMFVAPLINEALLKLVVTLPRKKVFIIWAIYDIGMILNWAPYNLFTGVLASGAGGFSIMTFITVYINVRMIRLLQLETYFTIRKFCMVCALYFIGCLVFSVSWATYQICAKGSTIQWSWVGYTTYNSPHVILMAIAVMLAFIKWVRIPHWLCKIVAFISPAMFGVYLLHGATGFGNYLYLIPERWLAESTTLSPVVIVFVAGTFTFFTCIVVDSVRRVVVAPFCKLIFPILRSWDTKLEL